MKTVAVVVPQGNLMLTSFEAPAVLFGKANEFLQARGEAPRFQVSLVGADRQPVQHPRGLSIQPTASIADPQQYDLVILPAVNGDPQEVIRRNHALLPWVASQHAAGAEVASLCIGAFLLAATGLMRGKEISTHWDSHADFRQLFPDVALVPESVVTDAGGLYSSGGATCLWNLLLYLLDKHAGRHIAIQAAKYFAIDLDRRSQQPFLIFQGQKSHADEIVLRAQAFIENHYHQRLSVDAVADHLALGRRNLERRFLRATANTVGEYIQRVKVEAAKARLEVSPDTVQEVMYQVGYTDLKAFRMAFKRLTGLSPLQYRSKYAGARLVA